MAKRIHAEQMGMVMGPESRILVCGGASRNKAILQVVADVFNVPVFSRVSRGKSRGTGRILKQLFFFSLFFSRELVLPLMAAHSEPGRFHFAGKI